MSVTRYRHIGSRLVETIDPNDGELVKASDYDALVSVCRELLARHCEGKCDGCAHYVIALALLDGEKNERVRV